MNSSSSRSSSSAISAVGWTPHPIESGSLKKYHVILSAFHVLSHVNPDAWRTKVGVFALRMVDYKAKYEFLVRNVLKDLESKVLVAQERAEKNAEGKYKLTSLPSSDIGLFLSFLSQCCLLQ